MLNDLQLLRKVTEALDQRQMLWNYAPKGGATAREDDEDMAAGMMEMDTESEENKVYVWDAGAMFDSGFINEMFNSEMCYWVMYI